MYKQITENKKYKSWDLLDEMPVDWKIDKTVGSPLFRYEFITNGNSVLNNQKRALLKIKEREIETEQKEPKPKIIKKTDETVACKKTEYYVNEAMDSWKGKEWT